MIIFAGINSSGNLNDVRVLSHANGTGGTPTWTQLLPSGTLPTARVEHSAVYDSTNNRMTVFGGGKDGATPFSDVWVLSNANGLAGTPTWTQLGRFRRSPFARSGHSAVYNSSTNAMVVFGGSIGVDVASEGLQANDVWVLTHANGLK